mgnify:CR=1 FL=1
MPYNVNVLTQSTALKYLDNEKLREQEIFEIKESRNRLSRDVLKIGFVKKVYASDSNFILIKVDDANKRYAQLINMKLVIRNRTNEPLCENCIRITVGAPEENKFLLKSMAYLDAEKAID